jgi:RimJ/RimL family protein N-acetyltransferase
MRLLESPTLSGRHVRLEPLASEHVDALFAASDESRATYDMTFVPASRDGMMDYVARALDEKVRGESIPFVVRDASGAVIGTTRFMFIEWWRWPGEPLPPVPSGPDAVEIGCTWYAERVQRTAVNTEAKLLLCAHAFETWGVRRVTWMTDARNARSRAAIERIGARLDGLLRAHRPGAGNVVRSTACYSMLASEWPDARRALVRRLERGRG